MAAGVAAAEAPRPAAAQSVARGLLSEYGLYVAAVLGAAGGCLCATAARERHSEGAVWPILSALGWALVLCAGYLLTAAASDATATVLAPPARGITATDLAAGDTTPAADGAADGHLAEGARRRSQASSASGDGGVDPVWEADWANLQGAGAEALAGARAPKAPEAGRAAVEVFALNDMPTWLARMQARRDQAMRAGKDKLVQKLDKEIADAKRTHAAENAQAAEKEQPAAEAPSGAGVGSAPAAPPTPEKIRERSASDELYGLDWSALGVDSAAKASAKVAMAA